MFPSNACPCSLCTLENLSPPATATIRKLVHSACPGVKPVPHVILFFVAPRRATMYRERCTENDVQRRHIHTEVRRHFHGVRDPRHPRRPSSRPHYRRDHHPHLPDLDLYPAGTGRP